MNREKSRETERVYVTRQREREKDREKEGDTVKKYWERESKRNNKRREIDRKN